MKYEKGQFVTVPNLKYLDGMKAVEVAVYLWICSYANEEGKCYPGRKTIAAKIKVSVHTVDKAINRLCEIGILAKEHRFVGNEKTSNEYQIMIPDEVGSPKPDTTLVSNETPPQPQTKHIELNLINKTKLTKQNNKFDVWWASYPKRRVDKEKCKTKFLKFPEEIQDLIIQDTQNRASMDDKWIKGFVPMTSTYLNNKKWEDDYEKVEEKTTGVKVYE